MAVQRAGPARAVGALPLGRVRGRPVQWSAMSRCRGIPRDVDERTDLVDLFEYQARDVFEKHGVPVLGGIVATTPAEARAAAERLGGGTVVVKAQVKTGGRGKAGGVKLEVGRAWWRGRGGGADRTEV